MKEPKAVKAKRKIDIEQKKVDDNKKLYEARKRSRDILTKTPAVCPHCLNPVIMHVAFDVGEMPAPPKPEAKPEVKKDDATKERPA